MEKEPHTHTLRHWRKEERERVSLRRAEIGVQGKMGAKGKKEGRKGKETGKRNWSVELLLLLKLRLTTRSQTER